MYSDNDIRLKQAIHEANGNALVLPGVVMTVTQLHDRHIELVQAVNNAKTHLQHAVELSRLNGFREGCAASGRNLSMVACDLFYFDQGIQRPTQGGLFSDWAPEEVKA